MKYLKGKRSAKQKAKIIIASFGLIALAVIVAVAFWVRYWYQENLKPLSRQSTIVLVDIPIGSSAEQIGQLLQQKGIIKSSKAFEWYVRSSNLRDKLKAGQYQLDAAKSVSEIVKVISEGDVKTDLFTILPGQRIDQIKTALQKAGFNSQAIDKALDPASYKNHPVLVAKPTVASLEGYLFPESFQTTASSTASEIIKQSLDQMANVLTPDIIAQFQSQGLGIHQAITLASIVEKEVSNIADRRVVAGVFLNRLSIGMVLGSDVTYHYAAVILGQEPTPFIDSPYNTRKYAGLPPGPISNVSASSLEAVANPKKTDYLYFVAGDDGKTYFSKTIEEHEALAREHCKILCSTY